MEKIAIFIDHANLERSLRDLGVNTSKMPELYEDLVTYIVSEHRFLIDSYLYFPVDPKKHDQALKTANIYRQHGFLVKTKLGKPTSSSNFKCNVDVEMAIDMVRFAHLDRADTICLIAGDGDMVPVVSIIREMGIRCEVASTLGSVANELQYAASGFINLELALEELTIPRT